MVYSATKQHVLLPFCFVRNRVSCPEFTLISSKINPFNCEELCIPSGLAGPTNKQQKWPQTTHSLPDVSF